MVERAEKQALLARHGRRLLNLLDDNPVVPGDVRPPFEEGLQARQILNDAEDDLREWQPRLEPVQNAGGLHSNAMPIEGNTTGTSYAGQSEGQSQARSESPYGGTATSGQQYGHAGGQEEVHPAHRKASPGGSPSGRLASGSTAAGGAPPYPASEAESHSALV